MNRKQRRAQGKISPAAPQAAVPNLQQTFGEALRHHQAGRLQEAENIYRQILTADSRNTDALHLLGVVAHQVGRNDVAVELFGKAIAINGSNPAYHANLGVARIELGHFDEAVAACRAAIRLRPDQAEVHSNLGNALKELGRLDDAVAAYSDAIRLKPDDSVAHANLGAALMDQGRLAAAAAACRTAIRLKPDNAEAYSNLGVTLRGLRHLDGATAAYGMAICLKPDYAAAHSNLGAVLKDLGYLDEAVAACRAAIRLKPNYAEAHANLGAALKDLGQLDGAVAACRTAIRLKPDYTEAHANLGAALKDLGRLDDAVAACRTAIGLKPDYAEAHSNLGAALNDLGYLDAAIAASHIAIRLKPDYADAYSNLLMCLHYQADVGERAILDIAREFSRAVETGRTKPQFANQADPERRLRIGYVSGDFGRHPVGYFLSQILSSHDRTAVDIFCYANSHHVDDMTSQLQGTADHWRSLVGVSDQVAAALVAADDIDILVDLSGHTARNRLPMFALKPAPVQVSWLGFWGTTGLSAMDYILSDDATIRPGEEDCYSERVLRLPVCRFCYGPPDDAPPPARELPLRRQGYVTFGSFNNLTKVGPEVIRLWAKVLLAVPASRLVLKWSSLAGEGMRRRLTEAFADEGIGKERLDLRDASPHSRMLLEYGDIDVALDPFPFSGGLTSCEALWMGVPVITLPGARAPSRQTFGFLQALGVTEWAAASPDDYIRIAVSLVADSDRLSRLRQDLRLRMASSSLCDGPAFTGRLETVYRQMWRQWCQDQSR